MYSQLWGPSFCPLAPGYENSRSGCQGCAILSSQHSASGLCRCFSDILLTSSYRWLRVGIRRTLKTSLFLCKVCGVNGLNGARTIGQGR